MKKSFYILLFIVSTTVMAASFFESYKYEDSGFAKKNWGFEKLDKKKFRESGYKGDSVKAAMAFYILKNQSYKGKPISLVFKELGRANGYFISDLSPAYVLQRPTKEKNEGWQLVFIPTKDGKIVKEIKIFKSCCD